MANWWDKITGGIAGDVIGALAGSVIDLYGPGNPVTSPAQGGPLVIPDLNPFGGNFGNTSAAAPAAPQGIQAGGASAYWNETETSDMGIGLLSLGNGYSNGFGTIGARRMIPYSGGIVPSGYRVAQRPPRRATAGHPGGTYLVPRRSMNPLNPRALLRAERRMNSFSTWVKRHFRIAAAAPKRRKGGRFKKRR